YFQGIDFLQFTDLLLELQVHPDDPYFADQMLPPVPGAVPQLVRGQWDLHVTGVPDAWRFTTGSSDILLVSLDTGVPQNPANPGVRDDLDSGRIILRAGAVLPTSGFEGVGNVLTFASTGAGTGTITRTNGSWREQGFTTQVGGAPVQPANSSITIQNTAFNN